MLSLIACSIALLPTRTQVSVLIANEGKSDCAIYLSPGASPSMKHGAEELSHYIQEMSGAKLPIVEGGAPARRDKPLIFLKADARMGTEEYRIQSTAKGLEISGGALRGVMYGCYAFLEDVLEIRWFNARVTKVPKKPTIVIGALNLHGKPAFEYREPFFTEAFNKDWAARNRVNGNRQELDASVGGKVSYGKFVHTFSELVPVDVYFDKHPEYFSMIDGKRMKGYYQLCLTNPDIVQIAADKVEEWIQANPDATIFSVSQNDTYNNCQCPECKAVEAQEGAPSGPLLRFVNKVAEIIEKKHPNVLIDTLAYQWSEKPPAHVRPRKNVRIRIAPIGACFSHPLDGCAENAAPLKNLQDWAKVTNQIYIWHYSTDFANYLQPFPNLDEIARDVALFKENGVVGFFDEGGYAPGGGSDLAELKSYLLAKLMWDPSRKAQPIIDEYIETVYGKAAPMIKQWIDLTHASGRAMKSHAHIFDPPTAPYLDDNLLKQGELIFNQAEKAVSDDPKALDEVQRTRLGLEYLLLVRTPKTDASYNERAKIVADKIRKYGIGEVREAEPVEAFLKRIGQG